MVSKKKNKFTERGYLYLDTDTHFRFKTYCTFAKTRMTTVINKIVKDFLNTDEEKKALDKLPDKPI